VADVDHAQLLAAVVDRELRGDVREPDAVVVLRMQLTDPRNAELDVRRLQPEPGSRLELAHPHRSRRLQVEALIQHEGRVVDDVDLLPAGGGPGVAELQGTAVVDLGPVLRRPHLDLGGLPGVERERAVLEDGHLGVADEREALDGHVGLGAGLVALHRGHHRHQRVGAFGHQDGVVAGQVAVAGERAVHHVEDVDVGDGRAAIPADGLEAELDQVVLGRGGARRSRAADDRGGGVAVGRLGPGARVVGGDDQPGRTAVGPG
jgi:hypothetical protein